MTSLGLILLYLLEASNTKFHSHLLWMLSFPDLPPIPVGEALLTLPIPWMWTVSGRLKLSSPTALPIPSSPHRIYSSGLPCQLNANVSQICVFSPDLACVSDPWGTYSEFHYTVLQNTNTLLDSPIFNLKDQSIVWHPVPYHVLELSEWQK